jgi:hypothetical protein
MDREEANRRADALIAAARRQPHLVTRVKAKEAAPVGKGIGGALFAHAAFLALTLYALSAPAFEAWNAGARLLVVLIVFLLVEASRRSFIVSREVALLRAELSDLRRELGNDG